MRLSSYLAEHGVSLNEFARRIGAKNGRTVQRYVKYGTVPSPAMMERIVRETEGAVQPNDFYSAAAE